MVSKHVVFAIWYLWEYHMVTQPMISLISWHYMRLKSKNLWLLSPVNNILLHDVAVGYYEGTQPLILEIIWHYLWYRYKDSWIWSPVKNISVHGTAVRFHLAFGLTKFHGSPIKCDSISLASAIEQYHRIQCFTVWYQQQNGKPQHLVYVHQYNI